MYKKYPDNISVIDKLVLATIKAFRVDEANEWVEREKNALIKMGTVTEKIREISNESNPYVILNFIS